MRHGRGVIDLLERISSLLHPALPYSDSLGRMAGGEEFLAIFA